MGKLTIQEVAKILTEKNGLTSREANSFATEMFSIILQRLQEGDMVKVKGLGTFKIINVEARESVSVRTGERVVIDSHSKVSFTPDTLMRELVNKPFSQFETVILNDGVEFEDIKDDITEEELAAAEETPVVEETPIIEEQPVAEEPTIDVEPSVDVEPSIVEEPPVVEEEPVNMVSFTDEHVASDTQDTSDTPVDLESNETPKRHWGRWLISAVVVLVLLTVAAYGGYEYGRQQQPALIPDTVIVKDTVFMAEVKDTLKVGEAQEPLLDEQPEAEEATLQKESPEVSKAAPKQEQPDQWAAKDERVRLGAYRIVGLSYEVTVQEGQTFYSICRAHLGPDMQCYVEVYNGLPQNPQIKAGQVLKIPKLELKRRRK